MDVQVREGRLGRGRHVASGASAWSGFRLRSLRPPADTPRPPPPPGPLPHTPGPHTPPDGPQTPAGLGCGGLGSAPASRPVPLRVTDGLKRRPGSNGGLKRRPGWFWLGSAPTCRP
ncbi:hypothetical protein SFR_5642 [Streptomyces sp. FR-008]|nr:hypothetical protein SFR_5642 [Streptomyces sp. FR-008]